MGEEAGTASTGSRPGSSTAKNRDTAKKRAALWKKQVKSFKLKDMGKKVDAVRFCARDERFFREQLDVLPLLMGFLSRIKTPELIMETLTVMHTLLSPPTKSESDTQAIDPEANAGFILERSTSADSTWKAGEPFINLFSANVLAPEIRIQAIEVFDLLLRASVALSASAGEATPALLQFQSVGSPCSALLGCLGVDHGDLQLAALSCLRSLLRNPPNAEYLEQFESEYGISRSLTFLLHRDRRYHRPALDTLESFSQFDCGRELLKKNGAASALCSAIQEAQTIIQKTSIIVPAKGMDASPVSVKDASLMCSNIGVSCQVFVRTTLAKEQVTTSKPVEDDYTIFMDVIDAIIGILRYDIATALAPVVIPTESPRPTGGANAAAAAAANAVANAAALAALFPFNIDRSVALISSLGRMIEYSERCKTHAKTKGLLPVLLDCFKVKEAYLLHQVADKLLHLCVRIRDSPEAHTNCSSQQVGNDIDSEEQEEMSVPGNTRVDPQILCAVANDDMEHSGVDNTDPADIAVNPHVNVEQPPFVAVETVLALLETSHETASKALSFRYLRWIATLVDFPGNANVLGERAVSLLLQILATTSPEDELFFAFLAKCIHAIVLQNSGAFELCGSGGHEPSTWFLKFLQQTSKNVEDSMCSTAENIEESTKYKREPIEDMWKLEWSDEYEEQGAFDPTPLTEVLHNVDAFLEVAEALTGLTTAFLKWNPSGNGSISSDFSDLIAVKLESDHTLPGKTGLPPSTTGSKKKLPADQGKLSAIGEAVMMCILEKGMDIPKLVSKYAAVKSDVCVALLGLLNNLLTVPGGMKVLLHLAKTELQSETSSDPVENAETSASDGEWPVSVQLSSRLEHTVLLNPIINVLQAPDTSFSEIEAAIRSMAVLTNDLESLDKEALIPAPEPIVETAKSPSKGGIAPVPVASVAPLIPELVVNESDRFINTALGCGALVVLLSFMDDARIPREADNFSTRVSILKIQIEEMVRKFITLAQTKQENLQTKYRDKLALEHMQTQLPTMEVEVDLDLPYQQQWAQLLLDHKFSVPRFGYVNYSALLLASELALPNLVSILLNAGASSETASPDGMTPLMVAFLVGNEEMVIDLLDARANIDAITTDGHDLTVWNCALVSPVKARVSNLVKMAYTNSENVNGLPTLSARIQLDSIEGSLQFLDMCLDAYVDVNVSNAQGDFLLHALLSKSIVRRKLCGLDLCFRYNSHYEDQRRLQKAVVDLLEGHAANVNSCNRMGQTALHLALLYGYTGIAKILLNHGANPNIQGIYGHLPLHYACLGFCGNLDGRDGEAVEICRLLLEQAPRYACALGTHSDRRKRKTTVEKQALAIEKILENGLKSVVEPPPIVLELVSAHQILTTPSFVGKLLPWHFACGAYVQLSSVLCLDDEMQTWFKANGQARADILRYLLREWHIDMSASASDGVTALHLAVKSDVNGNNLAIIDLLLETSSCCDPLKSSPKLNINAVHEHLLIDSLPVIPSGVQVAFVETNTHDINQAFVSTRSIDGKYHLILSNGKHVNQVSRDQLQVIDKNASQHSHHYKYLLPMESRFSALHYALQSNHDTLALRLLALPDISLDPEGSDLPLLALACAARQTPEVVSRLVTEQANMRVHLPLRTSPCDLTAVGIGTSSSIANRKHAAALHYAVMYDDIAMVEVLLTSPGGHVHPNVRRSRDGYTPLHLACQMENMKIIKLLLQHGASLVQLSNMSANGVSPLQLLMAFDSVENDKLKELIRDKLLRPEMLLEGNAQGQSDVVEDYDVPPCALLLEEDHNHDLFERLQGLNHSHEALRRRLEPKLEKSDAVLGLFFDLLKRPQEATDDTPQFLIESFQQLHHRHECYSQYTTRSQWKPQTKILRVVSKSVLDDVMTESTSTNS